MYRYGHFGFHNGPGLFGWFFMALFAALVVLLIVALVRAWRGPSGAQRFLHFGPQPGPGAGHGIDPALMALRVAYARGEINWEEYGRRAANLGFPVAPGPAPGAAWNPPPAAPPAHGEPTDPGSGPPPSPS